VNAHDPLKSNGNHGCGGTFVRTIRRFRVTSWAKERKGSRSRHHCGEAAQRRSLSKRTAAVLVPAIFLCLSCAGFGIEAEEMELFDPRPASERFAEMWRDIERGCEQMRQNGKAEAAGELLKRANELKAAYQVKREPIRSEKVELHAVGVYGGRFDRGPKRRGVVKVKVTHKAAPLILSLSAYEPVEWQLEIDAGVRLEEIFVSGYNAQEVKTGSGEPKITNRSGGGGDGTYCYCRNADYVRLASMLKRRFGAEPITFQGGYIPRDRPFVVGAESDDWLTQALMAALRPIYKESTKAELEETVQEVSKLRFQAMIGRRYGDFTVFGPIDATLRPMPDQLDPFGFGFRQIAYDAEAKQYYAVSRSGVKRLDSETGKLATLTVDRSLPGLSAVCGLTFDTKRRRLLVATMAGEGHLFGTIPPETSGPSFRR